MCKNLLHPYSLRSAAVYLYLVNHKDPEILGIVTLWHGHNIDPCRDIVAGDVTSRTAGEAVCLRMITARLS